MSGIYDLLFGGQQPGQEAAPQARPLPMPAPSQQGAPETVPIPTTPPPQVVEGLPNPAQGQQPVNPQEERVSGWKNLLESMKDPNVMQPMQTFFQAIAAPMAPWENTASRLARASGLMQQHKAMLAENAKNAGRDQELKDLEMRGKRAEVGKAEVGVDKARSDARLSGTNADVAEATKQQEIDAAIQNVDNLKRQGRLHDAQILEKEIQNKYADAYERAKVKKMQRDSDAPYFSPNSKEAEASLNTREQRQSFYDAQIGPYTEWVRAKKAEGAAVGVVPPTSFQDFLKEYPNVNQQYQLYAAAVRKAGGQLETVDQGKRFPTGSGTGNSAGKSIDWNSIK